MSAAPISTSPTAARFPILGGGWVVARIAEWTGRTRVLAALTSYLVSAIVHAAALIVLAIWIVPSAGSPRLILTIDSRPLPQVVSHPEFVVSTTDLSERTAVQPHEDQNPQPLMEFEQMLSSIPFDRDYLAQPATRVQLDGTSDWSHMLQKVTESYESSSAVVGDYATALQSLANDISAAANENNLLVVWCFDESISMKDDQQEIRYQMDTLYSSVFNSAQTPDRVLSTVTSYGTDYSRILQKPTTDLREIRTAIDRVPVHESGCENMCSAIRQAVHDHATIATSLDRKLILLLVTDETGDRYGNERMLEDVIDTAQLHGCRIFVLGRQASFGAMHTLMRWNGEHLQIDRGPETAYVEQLPCDVFRIAHRTLNSGFAPYEQARLAHATRGGLYLISGDEPTLVDTRSIPYDPHYLQPYQPDLRARQVQLDERELKPLRVALNEVVLEFGSRDWVRKPLPLAFPADRGRFRNSATGAIRRAAHLRSLMAELHLRLEKVADYRAAEPPRWRANFDLVSAQLVAYQSLCAEYENCLQRALEIADDRDAIRRRSLVVQRTRGDSSSEHIMEANRKMDFVQQEHPGTPWAARAAMEQESGFSVQLFDR